MFKLSKLSLFFVLFFVYDLGISQVNSQDFEEREKLEKSQIQKTFDSFLKAIKSKNDNLIEGQFSKKSIKYLDGLFDKVRNSDSLEIDKLSYLEKVYVLTYRHLFSKKDLLSKNRMELYIITDNLLLEISSGDISITDIYYEKAKVQLINNGNHKSDLWLEFIKENGKWKIDLTDYFNNTSHKPTFGMLDSKKKENNFLTKILFKLNGKVPKTSLWHPLRELTYTKIKSEKYFGYRKKYFENITIDSLPTNIQGGKPFTLTVNNIDKTFKCKGHHYCNYYTGYLKPLKQYVLTSCIKDQCSTYLLDKMTGKTTKLKSPSVCDIPSLSIDHTKLITYTHPSYISKSSRLSIATYIVEKTDEDWLKKSNTYYLKDVLVEEIVWIDNNTIALKVLDKDGESYLKSEIE